MKNLYTLIGKTNLDEAVKVEPIHIESFAGVKEVVKVKEPKKNDQDSFFFLKSTHWYKNDNNCKRNEVTKKTKMLSLIKI